MKPFFFCSLLKKTSICLVSILLINASNAFAGIYQDKMYGVIPQVEALLKKAELSAQKLGDTSAQKTFSEMRGKLPTIYFEEPGMFCGTTTRAYTLMLGQRNKISLCPGVLDQLPWQYLPQLLLHELTHSIGFYEESEATFWESAVFLYAGKLPPYFHDRAYGDDHRQELVELQTRVQSMSSPSLAINNQNVKSLNFQFNKKSVGEVPSYFCRWEPSEIAPGQKLSLLKGEVSEGPKFRLLSLEFSSRANAGESPNHVKIACFAPDGLNFYLDFLGKELAPLGILSFR